MYVPQTGKECVPLIFRVLEGLGRQRSAIISFHPSTMSVVDVVSPRVIEQGQKAWSTVKEQCGKINKPATGQSIGHCTPTPDCKLAMDYAIEDAAMVNNPCFCVWKIQF